jgi:YVTN family beta-propeller protein
MIVSVADPSPMRRLSAGVCAAALGAAAVSALSVVQAPQAAASVTQQFGYVVNSGANTVSLVNASTNSTQSSVRVGSTPRAVAITPDGSTALVANSGSNSVSVINLATDMPASTIGVGAVPWDVAITPDGQTAFVANTGSGTVSPLTLSNGKWVKGTDISGFRSPDKIAISPDGTTAFVVNGGSQGSVTPLNVAAKVLGAPIATGGDTPGGIAITPDGSTALVANARSNSITPINLVTRSAGTPVSVGPAGSLPSTIAITPDGQSAYVTDIGSNSVSPLTLSAGSWRAGTRLPVEFQPGGIGITPDGKTAYVANSGSNTIVPIALATRTVGAPFATGLTPVAIAFVPDQAPTASLVAPATTKKGTAVAFDASGSYGEGQSIVSYAWDFGDGTTTVTTVPTVVHAYQAKGAYPVTVTVTDAVGTSTAQIFTGQTVSRNGKPTAKASTMANITDPDQYGYVNNTTSLSRLDMSTRTISGTPITVPGSSQAVAMTPDGSQLLVTSSNNNVYPVMAATGVVGTPIPVGTSPKAVAVSPDGATALVANALSNTVTPLRQSGGAWSAGPPIAVGLGPLGVAITPDGTKALVVNSGSNSVMPLTRSGSTWVPGAPIVTGAQPQAVAVTPDGTKALVVNAGANSVTPLTLSGSTWLVAPSISVGAMPQAIAISPDGSKALVANASSNTVTPLTLSGNAWVPGALIRVGTRPTGIAITPDGSNALVTNQGSGTVTPLVLSGTAWSAAISLAVPGLATPTGVTMVPDQAPTAKLVAPSGGGKGNGLTFDASGSSSPSQPIVSYAWNFGDGATTVTSTPKAYHAYPVVGTYTASVTVTDAMGTSTSPVFTGQTVSRNGSPLAKASAQVTISDTRVIIIIGGPGFY